MKGTQDIQTEVGLLREAGTWLSATPSLHRSEAALTEVGGKKMSLRISTFTWLQELPEPTCQKECVLTCTGAKRAAGLADVQSPDQKKMVRVSLQQSVTAHIPMSPGGVRCTSIIPGQSEQRDLEVSWQTMMPPTPIMRTPDLAPEDGIGLPPTYSKMPSWNLVRERKHES